MAKHIIDTTSPIVFEFLVTLKAGSQYWITIPCRERAEVQFLQMIWHSQCIIVHVRSGFIYPTDQVWEIVFKEYLKKKWPSGRSKIRVRARMVFTSAYSASAVQSLWASYGLQRKRKINPLYSVAAPPSELPF
jgi:hypothetical protein